MTRIVTAVLAGLLLAGALVGCGGTSTESTRSAEEIRGRLPESLK